MSSGTSQPESHIDSIDAWRDGRYDENWTIGTLLSQQSAKADLRPAIVDSDGSVVSHREIADRARLVRGLLHAHGIETGATIGALNSLNSHWYAAVQAVLTSGCVFTALDPEAPAARTQSCLATSNAQLILADESTRAQAEAIASGRPVVTVEQAIEAAQPAVPVEVSPDSRAAYLFTSGSTGHPKAVIRSHRSMAHAIYSLARTYSYTCVDVMVYPGSPAHVGTLNDALCCMAGGFHSIPVGISDFSLNRVCQLLGDHPVTCLPMPPSLLRLLLRRVEIDSIGSHLRQVIASGEALRRSDVKLFLDVFGDRAALWQNYGSTETGPIMAGRYGRDEIGSKGPLPLSLSAHGCEVDVVNESGHPVPNGEFGDLRIRSPYLADGYLNGSDEDDRRFGEDSDGRYFHIGDRGARQEDGSLVLAGRNDRQISVHGRRFELGEIESAILQDRNWSEAVAVQLLHRPDRPMVVAVIESAPNGTRDVHSLRKGLEDSLPTAACPSRYLLVDQMPRTATGKLDHAAVLDFAADRLNHEVTGHGGPPKGIVENWLADCWVHVLGTARPGRDEPFDELGGDSIAAIELAMILEQRLGVQIPLDQFAEARTISDQVRLIERLESPASPTPLVTLRSSSAEQVCVFVPGIGGHAWIFAELARLLESPVSFYSVSLGDVLRSIGEDALSRDQIADEIASRVNELGVRRLVLGGYSLGAIMACDLASQLRARGVAIEGLVLIDPGPLTPSTTASRLRGLGRSVVESLSVRATRSKAAEQLRLDIEETSRTLRRLYVDAPVVCPTGQPTDLLLTEHSNPLEDDLFIGRPLSTYRLQRVNCSHLECIRSPWVRLTAAWLDRVLCTQHMDVSA